MKFISFIVFKSEYILFFSVVVKPLKADTSTGGADEDQQPEKPDTDDTSQAAKPDTDDTHKLPNQIQTIHAKQIQTIHHKLPNQIQTIHHKLPNQIHITSQQTIHHKLPNQIQTIHHKLPNQIQTKHHMVITLILRTRVTLIRTMAIKSLQKMTESMAMVGKIIRRLEMTERQVLFLPYKSILRVRL